MEQNNNYFVTIEDRLKENTVPQEQIQKVREAYNFAYQLHKNQYRISNEPYIVHPVEVSCILIDLTLDINTIIAALLHDVLEDTDLKPEVLSEKFGADVLTLVDGVTKLSKFSFSSKEERQAENFRKMFLAMARDIRIILLKLADRLHNMRTLNYMPIEKQKKIASETLEIFAPLANRLGIGKIKVELEDLCLKYLEPERYFQISQLVAQSRKVKEKTIDSLAERIQVELSRYNIKAAIKGRIKHFYSINKKMITQNKRFQEIYDITAIRIIVNSEHQCYEVLGIIHSIFKPIPGRFKDFIAMPKSNMYQSLHTSVIGPEGKPLEVQIRTSEMDHVAEYGVAAHWKYKEGSEGQNGNQLHDFAWLRKLVEIQNDAENAQDYIDTVKVDLFRDEVFVFTPKGDVYDLPKGAVPIDFAYRVHTDVGHRCKGAVINSKIATIDTPLRNGDIIEIITGKEALPKLDWLNIVATNQAKNKIKRWFKKNRKDENIALGKSMVEQALTKDQFDEAVKKGEMLEIAKQLNYVSVEDLLAGVGFSEISMSKITNRFKAIKTSPKIVEQASLEQFTPAPVKRKKQTQAIAGLEGLLHHLAKCCGPLPGEPIVGVVTRSRGISIHKDDCTNLSTVNPERVIPVEWSSTNYKASYLVNFSIEVFDRIGIFKDVLGKIADLKVNVTNAGVTTKKRNTAIISISIEIHDMEQMKTVTSSISQIPDVISIIRQQTGNKPPVPD